MKTRIARLNRRRFGLFVFHRAGTAAAISAAIASAFLAARFHRTCSRFTATVGFVAARGGRIIFSRRLRSFVFHRAIVAFRAARSRRGYARIVRLVKGKNRRGKRQNEHRG